MASSSGFRLSTRQPTSIDYERVKRNGFHDDRLLVVSLDDPRIGWVEREMLMNVGEKIYGKRKDRR